MVLVTSWEEVVETVGLSLVVMVAVEESLMIPFPDLESLFLWTPEVFLGFLLVLPIFLVVCNQTPSFYTFYHHTDKFLLPKLCANNNLWNNLPILPQYIRIQKVLWDPPNLLQYLVLLDHKIPRLDKFPS